LGGLGGGRGLDSERRGIGRRKQPLEGWLLFGNGSMGFVVSHVPKCEGHGAPKVNGRIQFPPGPRPPAYLIGGQFWMEFPKQPEQEPPRI